MKESIGKYKDNDGVVHSLHENSSYKLDISFDKFSYGTPTLELKTNNASEIAEQLYTDLVNEVSLSNKMELAFSKMIAQGRITQEELEEILNSISPTYVDNSNSK